MSILEVIVFLPIIAAIAIGFGAPARFTALGAALINLGFGLVTAGGSNFTDIVKAGEFTFLYETSRVLLDEPKLALSFGLDGISLVLVLLTVIVTVAAVWASPGENRIKGGPKLYYISSLLISAGALGAFLSTDLFFLYAFHELALIPTFLMIGLFGHGENRKRTAWTITIYLGVGSLILLAGLIALFVNLGGETFALAELYEIAKSGAIPAETQSWIYLLLLVGFGILVSLFPFHSWAPAAYADAPTPVSMLHAGVLKKFGLYGLIRVATPMLPAGAEKWMNLVLVLLLGNIIILGLVTIAQKRLDRMLGYSSVMHMGYIFLGVVAGTTLGMAGAVLLMFAHGISIALSFALAGSLRERFGSLEFSALGGGIGKLLPKLGLLFGFAAFASIGLPGFANFAAEVMVFFGAFKPMEAGDSLGILQWVTIISLWGVVISAVYMLRAYRNIFKGPLNTKATPLDLSWAERIPVLLLIVTLMLVGFVPELLLKFIRPALESLTLIGSGG